MRVPTDDEINDAAVDLGLADADGRCPPKYRSRVARAVQLAQSDTDETERAEVSRASAVDEIVEVRNQLAAALGDDAAATTITAALAPEIYRTAHERNRAHAHTTA